MKLLKTDLQKFAETFVDPSLGLLTKGTKLAFKSSSETDFVEVAAVKTVPDIGSDPEKVDVTSLEDDKKKSIAGLQDSTNLAFGVVYKGKNFYQLLDKQGTDKQYDWKITYPDGLTVTFKGAFSLKLGNAEVNKSMDYTITVVVSDGPDIAAPKSVTGVTLNKTTLSLKVGAVETLTASVTPTDAINKAGKWASDKTSIVTVDQHGKITAIAVGTAKITFKTDDGSFVATCTVTVTAA